MTPDEIIQEKLDSIIALLKPKWEPEHKVEEWEDRSDEFKVSESGGNLLCKQDGTWLSSKGDGYRLRKIDGLHNGPAFVVERRKDSLPHAHRLHKGEEA